MTRNRRHTHTYCREERSQDPLGRCWGTRYVVCERFVFVWRGGGRRVDLLRNRRCNKYTDEARDRESKSRRSRVGCKERKPSKRGNGEIVVKW
jgi:hypothetical protein